MINCNIYKLLVTEEASTFTALNQKQQQQRNIVYDCRMGCQLREDSLKVGVMCEVDHSWYLLCPKGLYWSDSRANSTQLDDGR